MSIGEEEAHLGDLVDQLEDEAMALDGGGDASGVHLLFRTVHNLKSLSAFLGQKELTASFHHLEDGLDRVRRGKEPWTAEWSDAVFRSIDLARKATGRETGPEEHARVAAPEPVKAKTSWGMPLTEAQADILSGAVLDGLGIYRIEKLFKVGLSREDFETMPVMEDVAEQGRLIGVHPPWEVYDQGPPEQVVKILFASPSTAEELGRIFFDPMIEIQAPNPAPPFGEPVDAIRCLIIEDDATASTLLGHIVKKHGSCMVAGTAREGYGQFLKAWERSEPYHIVFLDLHLPDLSGLAILSALRRFESDRHVARNRRCMVIISTASDSLEDIKASLVLDADGYLVKPVSAESVAEKIALIRETWIREA